jgi:RHS repeat-associated protein
VSTNGGDTISIRRRGPSSETTLTSRPAEGNVVYLHTDHLGAVVKATDEDRNIVWDAVRKPFGGRYVKVEQVEMPLGFPGQYYDKESGNFYNYFRDYDPATGRYLESDPIGLRGGLNTYAYVEGNPISYTDPSGLAPTKVVVWLVKICKTGIKKIRPVSYEEAAKLAKKGEDLQTSRKTAKQIGNSASEGRGAIKDPAHPDRVTGSTEGRRPHYHPNPRNGSHIFYSTAAAVTVAGHVDCEDCIMAYLAEGIDFFNPLSLPKDLMDITGIGAPD